MQINISPEIRLLPEDKNSKSPYIREMITIYVRWSDKGQTDSLKLFLRFLQVLNLFILFSYLLFKLANFLIQLINLPIKFNNIIL